MKNLEKLEICHLDPHTATLVQDPKYAHRKWEMQCFEGSWIHGATAGGCRNYLGMQTVCARSELGYHVLPVSDTFAYNPQFRITLTDPDEGDQEETCTCIIALLQKYRRRTRNVGAELLTIGFAVYKV